MATPGVPQEWAEAAKWHGVALFELKRRDDATRAWSIAKLLEPDSPLTEAMVRPEVARAYAAAWTAEINEVRPKERPTPDISFPRDPVVTLLQGLGVDEVIVAAIAIDAGVLTYAATRRSAGCGTQTIVSMKPDELVKRLAGEPCLAEEKIAVLDAPAIAHPRPAPSLVARGATREGRTSLVRKPWLWIGVVGALGLGVVLAVNLWPRDATYSATLDFHQFALGQR